MENTQKHTQGPWTAVVHVEPLYTKAEIYGSRGFDSIAEIWASFGTDDEKRANARLIAAAPDLLAVAKALKEFDDGNNRLNLTGKLAESVGLARAAIAKAEGVQ